MDSIGETVRRGAMLLTHTKGGRKKPTILVAVFLRKVRANNRNVNTSQFARRMALPDQHPQMQATNWLTDVFSPCILADGNPAGTADQRQQTKVANQES